MAPKALEKPTFAPGNEGAKSATQIRPRIEDTESLNGKVDTDMGARCDLDAPSSPGTDGVSERAMEEETSSTQHVNKSRTSFMPSSAMIVHLILLALGVLVAYFVSAFGTSFPEVTTVRSNSFNHMDSSRLNDRTSFAFVPHFHFHHKKDCMFVLFR